MLAYLKIFLSWTEDTEALKDAEKGRLIDALVKYARGEEIAVSDLSGSERILFPMYRNQIDRDAQEYAALCEKRKEAGSKGGKQKLANVCKCKQDKDKDKDKDKDEGEGEEDTTGTSFPPSLKKKIDNNYKHSKRARMAVAQLLVDQINAEQLPPVQDKNLYSHILDALEEGLSVEQIYDCARKSTYPGEFNALMLWANGGKWAHDSSNDARREDCHV